MVRSLAAPLRYFPDMAANHESNERFPSTTWEWKKVMVKRRPQGPSDTAAEGVLIPPLSRRDSRTPLTLTIRYRGGPEAWWEVKARGRTWRRPGWIALQDLMTEILEGRPR